MLHANKALYLGVLALTLASPARAETLEQAIAAAYENNPALQANRELASAADEIVTQAKAAYGPNLDISARHEYTTSRTKGLTVPIEDDGFATSAELALSQPLFTSGLLSSNLDAAKALQMAEREKLRNASQQLVLDVVNAYVTLRRDIELYGVASEIYKLLLQQRDVTASRYRLRDSTQPDLDQTTNRLELAAGRVISAQSTVEVSAARYRNLVGAYPTSLAPLPALPDLPSLEELYAEAETSNPAIATAKFTEAQSRARVGAARANLRPQVNAFAAAARSPSSPYQNTVRQESLSAGVSLTMPLYSGGQLSARLREAMDRNQADQQSVEQARRDVREMLAGNWSLLQSSTQSLPRYEAAVLAAERAVAGVKEQETSGIRTLRDVLDVTNDLLNARTAAVQDRAQIYLRHVAVLRDAGMLSISMFADIQPYDPDSSKAGIASLAGLPLRPLVHAIDQAFVYDAVPAVPVAAENAPAFTWPEGTEVPLLPLGAPQVDAAAAPSPP